MESTAPSFLELPEVTFRTSLSKSSIYNLIEDGKLNKIKLGRKTVFFEEEVNAFIRSKLANIGGKSQ